MTGRRLALLAAVFVPYVAVMAMLSSLLWVVLVEGPVEGVPDWGRALVDGFPWYSDEGWWQVALLPGLLIATTQCLFLLPVFDVRVRVRSDRRPLLIGLIGASFAAAGATTALLLAVSDIVWLVRRREALEYNGSLWTLTAIILGLLACSWLFWTPLLVVFSRRRPHRTTPGRLIGMLLGGTILELMVILPVDIVVRYRGGCYCTTASFHGTWLAGLVLLWLTGPGVIVAVTSRRRRAWLEHHCDGCGYPRGPSPGARCPECGRSWEPEVMKEKGDRRDLNP
ncbi:MAG: hypothetical protein ACYTGF_11815 [Planctomycetota bacterium]